MTNGDLKYIIYIKKGTFLYIYICPCPNLQLFVSDRTIELDIHKINKHCDYKCLPLP